MTNPNWQNILLEIGERAKIASAFLQNVTPEMKNKALESVANRLTGAAHDILAANDKDVSMAEEAGMSSAMLDRLRLTPERLMSVESAVRELIVLDDPIGKVLESAIRPNGIRIDKVTVPIGVIGIIYESRPNVTVDASMICLKAGNATILRGGREAFHTNCALIRAIHAGLADAGISEDSVQYLPTTEREAVNLMLKMDRHIDLLIPRGGESLIRAVTENSSIPVIKHYKGVCHLYVDRDADMDMAVRLILNGKCQRPGVCNALEKVLVHRDIAPVFLPLLADKLSENGVEMRGCPQVCNTIQDAVPATLDDWEMEYLALIVTLKVVDSMEDAVQHINRYGSHHSDCIVTDSDVRAAYFLQRVQSAVVYHNASTRFTDGGEFGMGAEIGISTDKLHARGPMGLRELTTYQYRVHGTGQIR